MRKKMKHYGEYSLRSKLYFEDVKSEVALNSGITLIALVITVIVLLILAGVSLSFITGSDGILSRAESAVKVTNEAGIEEETEMAILEKMAEYYESYDEKVVSYSSALEYVKSELVETQNYTTSSGASLIYDETNGNFLYIKDGKTIKMIADENGKVKIAKGTVSYDANGGTGDVPIDSSKYDEGTEVQISFSSNLARAGYNFLGWSTDKNATIAEYTESGNKKFEIGTYAVTLYAVWEWIPVTVTVQDIVNNPEEHYGGYVDYSAGGYSDWRIFYADENNIYITIKGVTEAVVLKDYASSRDGAVQYLNNTDNWTQYVTEKAEWAKGSIPITVFVESYNDVHTEKIELSGDDNAGYSNSAIRFPDDKFDIYIGNYWLASRATWGAGIRLVAGYSFNSDSWYVSYGRSLRPLVCLKTGVTLTEYEEGKYKID